MTKLGARLLGVSFLIVIPSILLLLSGCDQISKVNDSDLGVEMTNLSFEIKEAREIPWRVGKRLSKDISRGVTVTVKVPVIDEDDIEKLNSKFGVDSWVLRVTHVQNSKRLEVGSIYAPFKGKKHGRQSGTRQVKNISFALTYAASALSERFRMFNCPAFSHNKKIDGVEIQGENQMQRLIVQAGELFNDKPVMVSLAPAIINVGHELVGEYRFDVGLYRSHDRRLFSRLLPLSETIKIEKEEKVDIPECAGVHNENTPINERNIPFKIRN